MKMIQRAKVAVIQNVEFRHVAPLGLTSLLYFKPHNFQSKHINIDSTLKVLKLT